ncbi:sortase [Streptomyces sp. NPDC007861]|uniref:class E sortase n=1 Tax=Streptomyces sp. NPDC007861 TaxID=3154893 RepID=UPI003401064B
MARSRAVPAALACAVAMVLAGCSAAVGPGTQDKPPGSPFAASVPASAGSVPASVRAPSGTPTPAPSTPDARTEAASLSIPAIGLDGLRVVPYEGTTDDWPGTRIQNRGDGASPYGDRGGAGPGEIGNYLVTAHRLTAGGPLRELPSLDAGDKVLVALGGTVYEYTITESRKTSFRSERSLAEQRAAVPGFPGKRPTQAMITLSTCATPEDNAAGNFWRDDRHNPEHRIDKVGVLTAVRPGS